MLIIDTKNYMAKADGKEVALPHGQWLLLMRLASTGGYVPLKTGAERTCLSRLKALIGAKHITCRKRIGHKLQSFKVI